MGLSAGSAAPTGVPAFATQLMAHRRKVINWSMQLRLTAEGHVETSMFYYTASFFFCKAFAEDLSKRQESWCARGLWYSRATKQTEPAVVFWAEKPSWAPDEWLDTIYSTLMHPEIP